MGKDADIRWLDEPEEHDYPAARDYLELLLEPQDVARLVAALRDCDVSHYKAKDILRASALPLLPVLNHHVDKDFDKIEDEEALSPLLLVVRQGKLVVADGYHRLCAVYHHDEDAEVPVKIVWIT